MYSRRDLLRIGAALVPAGRILGWQDPKPDSGASPTVKFSTDVNVLATVHDQAGKVIKNLVQDDFTLEEDGRPQIIRYLSQQSDLPLTLGLLIDTSAASWIPSAAPATRSRNRSCGKTATRRS